MFDLSQASTSNTKDKFLAHVHSLLVKVQQVCVDNRLASYAPYFLPYFAAQVTCKSNTSGGKPVKPVINWVNFF